MSTIRTLEVRTKRRFAEAAKTIPADVVGSIRARAEEAVSSEEPHKICPGWVVIPFRSQGHDLFGLLQVANEAICKAQWKSLQIEG
jgi:hypothetical protein